MLVAGRFFSPLFDPIEDRANYTPSRPKLEESRTISERADDRSISCPNSLGFSHLDRTKSICINNDDWLSKITSVSASVGDQSLACSHGSMPFSDKLVREEESLEDEDLEIGKSELVNHETINIEDNGIISDKEDKDWKKGRKGSLV